MNTQDTFKRKSKPGKKAKRLVFSSGEISHSVSRDLICLVEYLEDCDEVWLVGIRDGKEIERHKCRDIEIVIWEDDPQANTKG